MKKIMFIVSLMSVVLVSCTNQKQEAPLAEEVEEKVTDVTFTNPQVSIAESMVTYTVTVSSSKGEEVLQKHLPILHKTMAGNVCHGCGDPLLVSLEEPIVNMSNQTLYHFDAPWYWNVQEYVLQVNTQLSDQKILNTVIISVPQHVSVEKYGKEFLFEDVNFTPSVSQYIVNTEYGKFLQKIPMRLDFGDYNFRIEIVSVNELYAD